MHLTEAEISTLKLLLTELERTTKHVETSTLHTKMIPNAHLPLLLHTQYNHYVQAMQSLTEVVLDTLLDAGVKVQ